MQPCDTVVKRALPCTSYGSFKMLKISASAFGTVSMRKQYFFATVTEGVVQSVHKVVTRSSFSV